MPFGKARQASRDETRSPLFFLHIPKASVWLLVDQWWWCDAFLSISDPASQMILRATDTSHTGRRADRACATPSSGNVGSRTQLKSPSSIQEIFTTVAGAGTPSHPCHRCHSGRSPAHLVLMLCPNPEPHPASRLAFPETCHAMKRTSKRFGTQFHRLGRLAATHSLGATRIARPCR